MSTDYELYKDPKYEFTIDEGSSKFTFSLVERDGARHADSEGVCIISFPDKNMSAEQVVDVAMRMLQPLLYNVEDPEEFKKLILKKVSALWA